MNLRFDLQTLEDRVVPATFIWSGLGADNFFSTGANWVGGVAPSGIDPTDDLSFDATATDRAPINDIPSRNALINLPAIANFNSITISASGYNITGQELTLGDPVNQGSGNIVINSDAINNNISANIRLGGAGTVGNRQTISVNGNSAVTITGRIAGSTGVELVKNGTGTLTLSGDNSDFVGPITLENFGGTTLITNALALGDTSRETTVGTGATLGVVNVAGPINEPLILNGFGVANNGALLNVIGVNTWAGPIALDSDSTFGSDAGTLRITGQISDLGAGHNLIKEGVANVTFVRDNTYRGTTTVNDGVLTIQHPLALGADGLLSNGTVVTQSLTKAGTLQIDDPAGVGFIVRDEILTLSGFGAGGIGSLNNLNGNNEWAASVILGTPFVTFNVAIGVTNPDNNNFTNPNDTLLISGVISSPNIPATSLTKLQTGKLIFNNNNTYAGTTNVAQGILTIRDSGALGVTGSGTTVSVGATLELEVDSGNDPHGRPLGVDSVTAAANRLDVSELLTINGRGVGATQGVALGGIVGGIGALRSVSGINIYRGNITLGNVNADQAIGVEPEPIATQNADAGYFTDDFSLTVIGDIVGDQFHTFVKRGTGQLILPNAKSYQAVTDIEQGWVTITNANALGANLTAPESATVQPETLVRAGASLHVLGGITVNENVLLFGDGITHNNPMISGRGALMSIGGNNVWSGDIELNGLAGIGSEDLLGTPGLNEFTITGDVMDFGTFKAKDSGGAGQVSNVIDMGTGVTSGTLIIDFNFFTPPFDGPNQLRVYFPPRGTAGSTLIFDSGLISGGGIFQTTFTGGGRFIEIVINEAAGGVGAWEYRAQVVTNVAGGMNKWGSKRLRLQGNNSYTLATNINGGVLTLQDDSSLGAASGGTFINAGAAIEMQSGPAPGAIPNNVNNGGLPTSGVEIFGESLTIRSTGNVTVTGTFIAPLTAVSGDNMWRGPVSLETGITVDTGANTRFIMLGAISNPGAFPDAGITKMGSGELVLNGVNTYRGLTDIRQGIVTIENGQALGTSNGPNSGTIVAADATIQLQGDITVAGESLTVSGDGVNSVPATAFRWFTTGPAGIANGETPGNDTVSGGRVLQVATDPTDDKVIYIAAATGGAWKTKDGGRTWNPLIDNINGVAANLQSMFVSQIVIDPTDTRIIYVATGEGNNATDSFYGSGIYRTADGGVTWTKMVSPSAPAQAANPGLGTPAIPANADVFARKAINKLVLDPNNPANLFVALGDTGDGTSPAGNNGIWRFTAATATWENIISDAFRSNNRIASTNGNLGNGPDDDVNYYFSTFEDYTDVVVGGNTFAAFSNPTMPPTFPNTFARVIAFAIGSADGGGQSSNLPAMGAPTLHFNNGVYVGSETSANGGIAWKRASFGTDETLGGTLFPTVGNIKLALSTQQVTSTTVAVYTLYATASYPTNRPGTNIENPYRGNILRGIFRTTVTTTNTPAAGMTPASTTIAVGAWAATTASPGDYMTNNTPAPLARGRGDFAQAVAVSPTDPNIVYVASVGQPVGLGLFQSTTGGTAWTNINVGVDGIGPHGYVHGMSFDRLGKLTVATDGGIWYLDNATAGAIRWVQRNGNLALTQFNGIDTHPTDPNRAVGGSRGNGVEIFTGSQVWTQTDRSEGGRVFIDPKNPNIYYAVVEMTDRTLIRKSIDAGQNWTTIATSSLSSHFGGFPNSAPLPAEFTALLIDEIDTNRILFGGVNAAVTAFTLFESSNGGATFTDLLAPIPAVGVAVAGVQGDFVADPAFPTSIDRGSSVYDPDTIYITDGASVFLTKNHGVTWIDTTSNLPAGIAIRDIVVDPRNRDIVYVVSNSLTNPGVFVTVDAGINWINITADLPANLPVWKLVVDPRFVDPATGNMLTTIYIGTDRGIYTRRFVNPPTVAPGTPPPDPIPLTGWTRFGQNMPNVQVRDLELNQNTSVLSAGTYGRSMYQFYLPDVIVNGGAVRAVSGSSVWTGPVTLVGDTVLGANGSQTAGISQARLNIIGAIGDGAGSFSITKIGGGSITFSGSNTYDGLTTVQEGVLRSNNRTALGTPGVGTVVVNGAALEISANLDLEPVTINGNGFSLNNHNTGALRNVANSNTYSGPLTLGTNVTIGADTGSMLTITGVVTDGANDFNIVKELTGTLALAAANTYDGVTDVRQGALRVSNNTALGSTAATDNTIITDGAQLQFSGGVTVAEAFTVSGTGIFATGAIVNVSESNTLTGPVTFASVPASFPTSVPPALVSVNVLGTNDTLTISGNINQVAMHGLTKIGTGRLTLGGNNTYSGNTLVTAGAVRVASNTALGTVAGNTVVSSGAALEYDGSAGSLNIPEALVVNGSGRNGDPLGALFNVAGANTQSGNVSLQTDSSFGANPTTTLLFTGVVSDPAPLLAQNFDAVTPPALPTGFATNFTGNAVAWTTDNLASTSGANSVFSGAGSPTVDDTSLFSPTIPLSGTNPLLSFRNFYDLQSGTTPGFGQDMAYLEVSVNGGVFRDILAAGGVFLSGGYNFTAGATFGNLFPGRPGWSGTSAGFEQVIVDLRNVASTGAILQFRWRVVTDNGTTSGGQRLDDIALSVASGVTKIGQGTVSFANANTYRGATFVNDGVLNISNAGALGAPTGAGTTVNTGGTLQVQGNLTFSTESLTLNGSGFGGAGALENLSGSNVWANPILLGDNAAIGTTAGDLTINAPIDDGVNTFGVTKVGSGTLAYGANAVNTYTGTTTVNEGTLTLGATGGNAIAGDLVVGDTLTGTATVQQLASDQIADTSVVTVQSDGVYDLFGSSETIDDLTINDGTVTTNSGATPTGAALTVGDLVMNGGTATAALNAGGSQIDRINLTGNLTTTPSATQTPTINGDGQFAFNGTSPTFQVNDGPGRVDLQIDALLSGFGGDTLTKTGAGRLSYSDLPFYSGGLVLAAGDFEVTGGVQDVMLAGGTLSGTGSAQSVTGAITGGAIDPGLNGTGGSTGILTTGTITADPSTTFFFTLNGTTPGTGHDQLVVNGDLNLNGATLTGAVGAGVTLNDTFTLLTYTGTRTGVFAAPQGANRVFINGLKFLVNYDDVAKSVVLTRVKNDAVVVVTSSLNPSAYGQTVTFTAELTPENGAASADVSAGGAMVTFNVVGATSGVNLTMAVAIDPVTRRAVFTPMPGGMPLPVDSYTVTVSYNGNADFNTANDTLDSTQVVNSMLTSTAVTVSPEPSNLGSPVGITVRINPQIAGFTPTGSVNVQINGGAVMNVPLVNGMASLPPISDLPQGASTIVVTYVPDSNFFQGSTRTVTHQTNPAGQSATGTTVTVTPEPSNIGDPATITVTVANLSGGPAPNGTVSVSINGGPPQTLTLVAGVATLPTTGFSRGNNTIAVNYNGDDPSGTFSPSSRTITHVVNPPTVTATVIGVIVTPEPSQLGGLATITATVASAFPGLTPKGTAQIIINGGSPSFVNLVNGQATLVTSAFQPGSNSIQVIYNGDDPTGSFLTGQATVNHVVNVTVTTPTVNVIVTPTAPVVGTPVTISASVVSQIAGLVPQGTATLFVNGVAVQTGTLVNGAVGFIVSNLVLGNNTIRVAYNGNDPAGRFNAASTTVNQIVSRVGGVTGPAFKTVIAYGADGGGSRVIVVDAATGVERLSIFAYNPAYTGGVKVATGDINGDGTLDVITATGPGGGPHVKAFDGVTGAELLSFFAYIDTFTGGVNVASADINGDGFADIVTGAGPGAGPHVKVFDGRNGQEISSFFAYAPNFTGGVNLAAGDLNGDGFAEIITGSAAIATHVKAFDGRTFAELRSFFAFDPVVSGGVFVAAGDVNGDGRADIIASPGSDGPHVRAFSGSDNSELVSFFAFEAPVPRGVRVGVVDEDRNGISEIIVTQGTGGRVRKYNPINGSLIEQDLPFDTTTIGVYVG